MVMGNFLKDLIRSSHIVGILQSIISSCLEGRGKTIVAAETQVHDGSQPIRITGYLHSVSTKWEGGSPATLSPGCECYYVDF